MLGSERRVQMQYPSRNHPWREITGTERRGEIYSTRAEEPDNKHRVSL
jgi:hypothetical protein